VGQAGSRRSGKQNPGFLKKAPKMQARLLSPKVPPAYNRTPTGNESVVAQVKNFVYAKKLAKRLDKALV
jgi:hypothetical protein